MTPKPRQRRATQMRVLYQYIRTLSQQGHPRLHHLKVNSWDLRDPEDANCGLAATLLQDIAERVDDLEEGRWTPPPQTIQLDPDGQKHSATEIDDRCGSEGDLPGSTRQSRTGLGIKEDIEYAVKLGS
ncbi:hypothetical protein FRB97_001724 [Tulasnella sp. 331]|nr:hypothetical protein FRB97_001724 [Tulasnella sp. 331]